MKVDYTIVAGILGQVDEDKCFRDVVLHLVKGLNDVTAIYDRMEFLKREQDIVNATHLKAIEELENQMIEAQSTCPHFTLLAEIGPEHNLEYLVCATCRKLVENHHDH